MPIHFPEPDALPGRGESVLVAMSGGVDSAVAALLLREAGCRCTGLTYMVLPENASSMGVHAAKAAADICDSLGIAHIALPVHERFAQEVIAPFVAEYACARTPNPCIVCNRAVKFQALAEEAERIGARRIATGHYARTAISGGRAALMRARCAEKDQSYVLANLRQDQLARACFPLGGFSGKEEIRAIAERHGLPCAHNADSQEICFLEGRHYTNFLEERIDPGVPGPIRALDGTLLGEHRGLYRHTIGQRRGLGLPAAEPWYVARLDAASNTIYVGRGGQTACASFDTGPVNWVAAQPGALPGDCAVQLRYRHVPAPCGAVPLGDGFRVRFQVPQRGVTPGQWAVFYRNDTVAAAAPVLEFQLVDSRETAPDAPCAP